MRRSNINTKPNYQAMRTTDIIFGAMGEIYRRYKVGMWQSVAGCELVTMALLGARHVGLL